jgi:hypothetical protein
MYKCSNLYNTAKSFPRGDEFRPYFRKLHVYLSDKDGGKSKKAFPGITCRRRPMTLFENA